MGYIYLGEAAGGRILRYGQGFSQVGGDYQLVVRTWPNRPLGISGDASFRRITALIRHTQGYNIKITPIVDGVAQAAKSFSGGAPSGGLTEELVVCPAPVFRRGSAIEAIIETVSLSGETEIVDVQMSFVPIRQEA